MKYSVDKSQKPAAMLIRNVCSGVGNSTLQKMEVNSLSICQFFQCWSKETVMTSETTKIKAHHRIIFAFLGENTEIEQGKKKTKPKH